MKKVIAINGSPRKKGNTAVLLQHALDGASEAGAATEMIHLYDLDYQGCISCFACKKKNSKFIGRCASRDGLSPVLEKAMQSTVLLLGSPIYFGNITGEMQSFLERLLFMNLSYDHPSRSTFTGCIHMGFIYTMGLPDSLMREVGYDTLIAQRKARYSMILKGKWEDLISTDTCQFDDYSQYAAGLFDEAHKKKVQAEQFPIDCEKAHVLGKGLAG